MKTKNWLLSGILTVGAIAMATTVAVESPAPSAPKEYPKRVRPYVAIDGDTFIAAGDQTVYRLYGVDAPEHDQPWGDVAQQALRQLVQRREVTLTSVHGNTYNRPVVTVTAHGEDVGLVLLRMGLAWYTPKYAPERTDYAEAEREARKNHVGIWSEKKQIPPWEWREKRLYKITE